MQPPETGVDVHDIRGVGEAAALQAGKAISRPAKKKKKSIGWDF